MTRTLVLMYREGDFFIYSRYVSNQRTDKFISAEPLEPHWVEVVRSAPETLRDDEEGRDIAEDEHWQPPEGPAAA